MDDSISDYSSIRFFLAHAGDPAPSEAVFLMIVHHAYGLHESVADRCANEAEAALFQTSFNLNL